MQCRFSLSWVMLLLLGTAWSLPAELSEEEIFIKKLSDGPEQVSKFSEALKSLERTHINALVWSVQQVLDALKGYQREAYKAVAPEFCPLPEVPSNGGVVCVHIRHVHYCKPMCNQGYDFSFLRRSRLYEECGDHTGRTWTTQYIGGKQLANCIASKIPISGVPSAYFPEDMKCQKTIGNSTEEEKQIDIFLAELKEKGIVKEHDKKLDCIICGD